MSFLPAYINLENKNILIVGGGTVATRKVKYLLDFTTNIKIISPKISTKLLKFISKYNLKYKNRKFKTKDLKKQDIIITAINNIKLQKNIFKKAKQLNIWLINSSDNIKHCDFIFPSYIKKGDLTISISTNGKSPTITKYLKKYLNNHIPDSINDFIQEMYYYRKILPKGKKRMQFLKKYVKNITNILFVK